LTCNLTIGQLFTHAADCRITNETAHNALDQHSTIVIDEAHELSLNIEFLSPMGVDHIHNARNYCFQ
jgi:hypothetical protein